MPDYPAPIDILLVVGEPEKGTDYIGQLALTEEHIPDLIRLALDEALYNESDPDDPAFWGPIHAWRALGQLRAEAAIQPFMELIHRGTDDDWIWEEIPDALALIGPAAIPALKSYVAAHGKDFYTVLTATSSLEKIAKTYPETRDGIVAFITTRLAAADENDPSVNGSLIADLIELKAHESLPEIERAFRPDLVDEGIAGDWYEVQVEFGLKEPRPRRRRELPPRLRELQQWLNQADSFDEAPGAERTSEDHMLFDVEQFPSHQEKKRAKARRKQADKSRKANRRKRR